MNTTVFVSGAPDESTNSPSILADLKVEAVLWNGEYILNISWAINIDGRKKTFHFVGFKTVFLKRVLSGGSRLVT